MFVRLISFLQRSMTIKCPPSSCVAMIVRNISDNQDESKKRALKLKQTTMNHSFPSESDLNRFTTRTFNCGQLNDRLIGKQVQLCG